MQKAQDISIKIILIELLLLLAVTLYGVLCSQRLTSDIEVPIVCNNIEDTELVSANSIDDNLLDAISQLGIVDTTDENQTSFMSVDLMSYVEKYPNVCAYIQIPGTYIDFPVVQYADNEYYLNKGYAQQDYDAGSPFLDYRNNIEYLDSNNVIYAHNMADGSMFGTLQRLKNETYFKDNDGFIYLNSIGHRNLFKIYSVYEIDLVSFNFIQTGFDSTESFNEFLIKTNELNQSDDLNMITPPENTKILTLSTCTAGGAKRLVVHAYLYNRNVY